MGKPNETDFMVCRCEEVSFAELQRAMDIGSDSVEELKLRTRASMGVCQGRTCLTLLRGLLMARGTNTDVSPAYRWPVRPVKMGTLKRELPPGPALQIPLMEVDLESIDEESSGD